MKKLPLLFLLLASGSGLAQDPIDDVVLPRKTQIFVELERAISSKTSAVGERFYGKVQVPVTVDDRILIPAGTFILGQIDSTRKPGTFRGTGEVELSFDTLILPDGTTREMRAVPQSAEGQRMDPASETGKIKADSEQADEVIRTATFGGAVGGTAGGSRGGIDGMGIGSAIGAATGAIVGLVFRGKHVTLPKGTSLTLQLDQAIRFVPPAAKPSGKVLKP